MKILCAPLARFLVVACVGTGAASACGRSWLYTDVGDDGELGGASATAGRGGASTGGSSVGKAGRGGVGTSGSVGVGTSGSVGVGTGGFSVAGAPSMGGNSPMAEGGVAGEGAEGCQLGSTACRDNGIVTCSEMGSYGAPVLCAEGSVCTVGPAGAECSSTTCLPNSRKCVGNVLLACAGDGTSWNTVVACPARGQRCYFGECRSMICAPGQAFCDPTGLRLCDSTGTLSVLTQACAAEEFCDPRTLACAEGVCVAEASTCAGTVATSCDAYGTSYAVGGTDCDDLPGQTCVEGSCVCQPGLANCNGLVDDGCETDIATDFENCMTCGATCSSLNLVDVSCDGGCRGQCVAGFADCNDDKQRDGCEVELATSAEHCGACGSACSVDTTCVNGVCQVVP